MNRVILVGNLVRDPELTTTTSGISICRFTLAVSRRFSNSEENNADFFTVIVWREQGENCNRYLRKGSKAGVVGRLQTRTYDDKEGVKRYVTEIIADEVEFLSSPRSQGDDEAYTPAPAKAAPSKKTNFADLPPIEDEDGLPF